MLRTFVPGLTALACACPMAAQSQTVVAPGFNSVSQVYQCAGGAKLPVVTLNIQGGDSFATLYVDGTLALLRSGPTGSGANYIAVDEQVGYRWRTKEDQGVLLRLAPDHTAREKVVLQDCKVQRAQ